MHRFNKIILIIVFIIVFNVFVVGEENYPKPENKIYNALSGRS